MKLATTLLSATLLIGSMGAALASPVDPQSDITHGSALLETLPFGSSARVSADNLLTEARQDLTGGDPYHAYLLARQAEQIEQTAVAARGAAPGIPHS
jgi:hypothetical protein